MRYVAFLRGINVGGKHRVKMEDLRRSVSELGLNDVQTYIQSGNILFSYEGDEADLYEKLERHLEKTFGFRIPVILRTKTELESILANTPFDSDDLDYSHQFITLFRDLIDFELPADPPKGGCAYLGKTEREIYSWWWKVDGKYNVPSAPKTVQAGTARNRKVLIALRDLLG